MDECYACALPSSAHWYRCVNSFIYDLCGRLANESRNLITYAKRKTMTAEDIQSVRPSPAVS